MPKLVEPTIVTESNIELPGCSPDDPLSVSFRQATEADRLARQQMLTKPLKRTWETPKNGQSADSSSYAEEMQVVPYSYRRMVDCFLTMTACNLEDAKGGKVFKFISKGKYGLPEFDGGIDEFEIVWGRVVEDEWLEFFYDTCLGANGKFGDSGENDEGDTLEETPEEALTEGEGEAGAEPSGSTSSTTNE